MELEKLPQYGRLALNKHKLLVLTPCQRFQKSSALATPSKFNIFSLFVKDTSTKSRRAAEQGKSKIHKIKCDEVLVVFRGAEWYRQAKVGDTTRFPQASHYLSSQIYQDFDFGEIFVISKPVSPGHGQQTLKSVL